jgi:hypothetical protein
MTSTVDPLAGFGEPDAVPGPQPEPARGTSSDATEPLPATISIPAEFAARIPTQRVLDSLAAITPEPLTELMANQATRIIAFRALLREFPERDPTSLWMHAYDVELEIFTPDPTDGRSPTPPRRSATTGE